MTKIANNKPNAQKVPVYVTKNKYEIWYSKPLSLGLIEKHGEKEWVTADNQKFPSSRDAMEYLVRLHDLQEQKPETPESELQVLAKRYAEHTRQSRLRRPDPIRVGATTELSEQQLTVQEALARLLSNPEVLGVLHGLTQQQRKEK